MAFGTITKFNQFESILIGDAGRQWDDATAGSCMFVLAKNTYTPDATHTTLANVGVADTDYITTGDGLPINLTNPVIDDTTTAGSTYLDSDPANFGVSVTITAKYLMCVQPVVAGTSTTTDKLLWYVDLDDASGTASLAAIASDFVINAPINGWVKFT